jgi:hypothetical protein
MLRRLPNILALVFNRLALFPCISSAKRCSRSAGRTGKKGLTFSKNDA